MNKAQKAVEQVKLDQERAVLDELTEHYEYALKGINERLQVLQSRPETQSNVYRKEYQQTMKNQVSAILENLHANVYQTIDDYMHDAYTTGFVGTMYDLHYQNVPLLIPINRDAVLKAVQHDTKLTSPLYDELGIDTKVMSKNISRELSRGLASGLTYDDIARNIRNTTKAPMARARNIARTEGHRIQQASAADARAEAKAKGADVVKQWDSTLDGDTRPNHRQLDGQIREIDEPFEVGKYKPMHPGDFNDPAEDCNCRCVALTRARAALDEDELKTLRERAVRHSLYVDDPKAFRQGKLPALKNYEEFQKSYLKAAESIDNSGKSGIINATQSEETIFAGTISKQNGITKQYEDVLNQKFSSGTDEAKKVFNKFVSSDSVANSAYKKTPHFLPADQKIYMDFSADAANNRGPGATFFHEHGHYIDFMAAGSGNYNYLSTNNKTFGALLRSDYKSYVSAYRKSHNLNASDAYFRMSGDLAGHDKHSISDLMDGLSKRKCSGWYGHKRSYWKYQGALEREAFAHMYEASFDTNKTQIMQQYFPNAFAEFLTMLKGLI